MKYFWVLFSQGNQNSFVGDIVDFKGVSDYRLSVGERLDQWDQTAYVAIGPNGQDGPPDDVLQTASSVPIFSNRLRTTLDQAGITGIQYLPITIQGLEPTGPYFVVNVLARPAALDEQASVLSRYEDDYFIEERRGQIGGLRVPVLRNVPELSSIHIFRLAEYWPHLFVSGRFRDVFKLGKFTGMDFNEVLVSNR